MVVLETGRLIVRHFHVCDAEAMDTVFGDAEVMRFEPGVQTKQWVRDWLCGCLENYYKKWGFGRWALVEKSSWRTIGYCDLFYFEDIGGQSEIEIGYRLARRYWGKGYATEAVLAVRDYGFGTLCMARLISMIDSQNAACIRVAEKAGMHHEKDVMLEGYSNSARVYAIARPGGG